MMVFWCGDESLLSLCVCVCVCVCVCFFNIKSKVNVKALVSMRGCSADPILLIRFCFLMTRLNSDCVTCAYIKTLSLHTTFLPRVSGKCNFISMSGISPTKWDMTHSYEG